MKHLFIVSYAAAALTVVAAPQAGYREPTIAQDQAQAVQTSIRQMPDFVDLTNQLAQFVIDKQAFTNDRAVFSVDVAAVSDAATKQALLDLRALHNDQLAMQTDLKQACADMKRLIKAIANSTTNNATLNQ